MIDTLAAFCQRHPCLAELDGACLAAHFSRFMQTFISWLLCLIPSWRSSFNLEIDLIGKTRPIAIEPRW